jgi:long-chain acyl-CoA synthetase
VDWIIERMNQWQERPSLIWKDSAYSYQALLDKYDEWEEVLDQYGIAPGHVVALHGDFSPAACSLLIALIRRNTIVVPLSSTVDSQIDAFLDIAEVQFLISVDADDDHALTRFDRRPQSPVTQKLIAENQPGLVLFSSGSTGKPKGAVHNFTKLLEKFKKQRHRMVALNFLLFDHIGGINTLFYNLSNGGTVVTTHDRNPSEICRLIEKYKIELLPTTPTFLNLLVMSGAHADFDLSSLNLITYGTEVMQASLLSRLHDIFPGVRLLQTYGLSELGIMRSKSKSSDSLWVKIGGEDYQTKVVDGILWIKAKSSMIGYLNAPDPFTEDGWFVTGDSVEVDGEYLKIKGRTSDLINVGGEKVYPAEVESVLLEMPGVKDVSVYGVAHAITGHVVAAKLILDNDEPRKAFKQRMRAFCKTRLEAFKIPQKITFAEGGIHSARFKKRR